MKTLVLLFLCAVAVNARFSIYAAGKAEGDEHDHGLDWWEHGVFYQVTKPHTFSELCEINVINYSDLPKLVQRQ